jgi:hypothetical protein
MARGNNSREGRAAKSELSRKLRDEAEYLRRKNADEAKEAEDNETEYDRAMKSAIMRAQDEVDEEFKNKRMEIDEEEHAGREEKARKAEEAAKAEEEREAKEKAENETKEAFKETIKNELSGSSHPYSDYGHIDSKWGKAGGRTDDKDAINPDVNIPIEQRNYIKQDYIDAAVEKAPKWMKEELKTALDAFSLGYAGKLVNRFGPRDFIPYETLGGSFDDIYLRGAFGKDASKADIHNQAVYGKWDIISPSGGPPTKEQHAAGMKAIDKFDSYIAKVLAGARKGGHTERHPEYDPTED